MVTLISAWPDAGIVFWVRTNYRLFELNNKGSQSQLQSSLPDKRLEAGTRRVYLNSDGYGQLSLAGALPMAHRGSIKRRNFLTGLGSGLSSLMISSRPSLAQVTDLRGFDPLWRSAEDAIYMFFGNVTYQKAGIEIDLPEHSDVGSSVPLTVRIVSSMTEEDYPKVVHVMAHGNPTPHVMSVWFQPKCGKAEFSTRIRLEKSQKVTVVAQMSDGRYLRLDQQASVSFGACAQIGTGTNDDVFAFQPQTRVNVPAEAKKGDFIPIRAIISHPMETGLRLDPTDEWVRKRIISRFECSFNDASLFRARLYPAVSTNPYFLFYLKVEDSGRLAFNWYDMTGPSYDDQAFIKVV